MNFDGARVRRIETIGDPDRADMVEVGEVVVVRREARHVVGVVVGEDDEREAIAGRLLQVLHAVVDAADVGGMNAAIDQDVRRARLARHRQQEEIAEADAVHAHADAELAATLPACRSRGGLVARLAAEPLRRGVLAPAGLAARLGLGFAAALVLALALALGLGLRARPSRRFAAGFRGFLGCSHDQYSSCTQAEVGLEVGGIRGVAGGEPLRQAQSCAASPRAASPRRRHSSCRWRSARRAAARSLCRFSSAFSVRRLDDQRDAAAERKAIPPRARRDRTAPAATG